MPIGSAARDVLGLASSSSSVERLFSHAGHVLGKKRGSLSARKLVKQCSLEMWDGQGFFSSWGYVTNGFMCDVCYVYCLYSKSLGPLGNCMILSPEMAATFMSGEVI
jgi:hypothetical protein